MNYTVINQNDALHIIGEDALPIYYLDCETLQKLSCTDDANCSACIFHLASYGILPTAILYQIASYIQKKFSGLQVDWLTTFYHVEKNTYISTAFRMKELLEEKNKVYGEDRLIRFIAFEGNEFVENVDSILLKIVMMNMINFDVKVR